VLRASDPVKILVVGLRTQDLEAHRELVGRSDRQCYFAKSDQDAAVLLKLQDIDVVLSTVEMPGESARRLTGLLLGSRMNAFYSLRVEVSYWWLPVVEFGKSCLGAAAFRPHDFAGVFEQLVKQIRINVARASGDDFKLSPVRSLESSRMVQVARP